MRRSERPVKQLPVSLMVGFLICLALQFTLGRSESGLHRFEYQELERPFSFQVYRTLSLGSTGLAGALFSLQLQLHDNQFGEHFSYKKLDYSNLIDRLNVSKSLSEYADYPMLLATRVYTNTTDIENLRLLVAWVEKTFDEDPQRHWRHLTEAVLIAKHKINDLDLALRLALKLFAQPTKIKMPHWARDMKLLILADLNQYESAIAIIEALLASNSIDDNDEKRFLREKLSLFQQKVFESRQIDD
ncbi:MAG: hypothetical protein ACI845_002029 [Gammaproteobacteria bacterium]|jgi:hypothetical protein